MSTLNISEIYRPYYHSFTTHLIYHGHTGEELPQRILDALPQDTLPFEYLPTGTVQAYAGAGLMIWQEILKKKYAQQLSSMDCPLWLSIFTSLSAQELKAAAAKSTSAQVLLNKIKRAGRGGTTGKDWDITWGALRFAMPGAKSADVLGQLLREIHTRITSLGSQKEIGVIANKALWVCFGLVIARKFRELAGEMSRGVADAGGEQVRREYRLVARLLVNFAQLPKAPVAEALGASRAWITNVLRDDEG